MLITRQTLIESADQEPVDTRFKLRIFQEKRSAEAECTKRTLASNRIRRRKDQFKSLCQQVLTICPPIKADFMQDVL
ncbi:MAG: hypothetical protein LBF72_01970 [Holosporales bacterium]|nr:hypothetical protein [Holosporales bacterium]